MKIGDYLRAFRAEHELTKAELATRLRSKLRTVEDWEAERRTPPDMLPLALAAAALEIRPWAPRSKFGPETTPDEVRLAANWTFSAAGQSEAADKEYMFSRCIPAEARPSEALLFARLMVGDDGYNGIETYDEWEYSFRAKDASCMVYKPDLSGATPTIGIESRYGSETRITAIFVDSHRPGERSPSKLRIENALLARGRRVMSFSETEIFHDADGCRRRVEDVLYNQVTDCLAKLGFGPPPLESDDE